MAEYHLFAPTSAPIAAARITTLISSIIGAMTTSLASPAAMAIDTGLAA